MEYNVVCECCGKSFIASRCDKRYCSKKCKDVGYKRSKGQNSRIEPRRVICKVCGKEFETFNGTKSTCSEECSKELIKQRRGTSDNKIAKKCAICEKDFLTYWNSQMTCGADACKKEYEKKQKKMRHNREKNNPHNQLKLLEKQWYNAFHTVERECIVCGSLFYCLDSSNKKTCSSECGKRWNYRKADKRIPKEQIRDRDISLKRLYKRDRGVCWICGGLCDFNSRAISKNGYEYPGDDYPEVEHVIPISRGGLHSWDNVRLAHRKCNAKKSDILYPYVPLDKEFAYKEKAKRTEAKPTIQMTLDGEVVKVWNSTGEIRRALGYNDKYIQSICRGKGKTAYGFVWKYLQA